MAYQTVTVHHKKYPHTSVMASPYLCDNTGTLNCAADLEDLKAYLSNVGEVFFPEGTYLLSDDLTIPVGMFIRGPKAVISIAAGKTLTLNGPTFDDVPAFIIADTASLVINGAFNPGLRKVFTDSNSDYDGVVFDSGVVEEVYPEWWALNTTPGTTDMTAAITAAWNCAISSNPIRTDLAESMAYQKVQGVALRFGPSEYLFNGAALTWSANRFANVRGAGAALTRITNTGTGYLFDVDYINWLKISDLHCYGGKGLLRQSSAVANVTGFVTIEDNWITGYSECGVGFNATDKPYVRIFRNQFHGEGGVDTIGVCTPKAMGGDGIAWNDFTRNKYHVKVRDGGGSGLFVRNNDFLRIADQSGLTTPCHDVWIVPRSSNSTSSLILQSNKFGNENLGTTDYRILIADEDAIGSDALSKHHVETDSTGYACDLEITNNMFVGNAGWTKSYVNTFCPNTSLLFKDNILNGTLPSVILSFDCTAPIEANVFNRNSVISLAGSRAMIGAVLPLLSNVYGVGSVIDPLSYSAGQTDWPTHWTGGGRNINYAKILTGDNVVTSGSVSDCSRSGVTDSMGGANAVELTYTDSAGYLYLPFAAGAIVIGRQAWFECDLLVGASNPLAAVELRLAVTTVGDSFVRRIIKVPSAWTRVRIPFVPRQAASMRLLVYPSGFSSGVTETVKIGRVSVYHGTEPENLSISRGTFTSTASAATTVVTDARATTISQIAITPTAAASAAEVASTYVSAKALGSFTVTHPNNATAGKTWNYILSN